MLTLEVGSWEKIKFLRRMNYRIGIVHDFFFIGKRPSAREDEG